MVVKPKAIAWREFIFPRPLFLFARLHCRQKRGCGMGSGSSLLKQGSKARKIDSLIEKILRAPP